MSTIPLGSRYIKRDFSSTNYKDSTWNKTQSAALNTERKKWINIDKQSSSSQATLTWESRLYALACLDRLLLFAKHSREKFDDTYFLTHLALRNLVNLN